MKTDNKLLLYIQKTVCFAGILLISLGVLSSGVEANESFTLDVSFYQGINLNDGMTEIDPTVLTLMFGDSEQLEFVLEPELDDPFDFSPAVDFHFEYDSSAGTPTILPSDNVAAIAVLHDTSFNLITPDSLQDVDFQYDFSTVAVNETDTLLLLTQDTTYIKIGNIEQLSDLRVGFEYEQMADEAVPEPSTLFLLGIGLLGVAFAIRRKMQ